MLGVEVLGCPACRPALLVARGMLGREVLVSVPAVPPGAQGTRFPRRLSDSAHAQCALGGATAFPSSKALAGLCGGMAALVVVFCPLPRLRGLLQRCWGRLERGLLLGFSGGQSLPWGRYRPAPVPAEGRRDLFLTLNSGGRGLEQESAQPWGQ